MMKQNVSDNKKKEKEWQKESDENKKKSATTNKRRSTKPIETNDKNWRISFPFHSS